MADRDDTPDLFGTASSPRAVTASSGSATASSAPRPGDPLAVRMRPSTLDEVVGQSHLLGPGTPLRRLVESDAALSVVLWGPPGTGKTTIAHVVSRATARRFVELSALTAGVKEVRHVIAEARERLSLTGTRTVLFIDEVHRFSRTQQDSLLAAVENRWVSLIAATTENPSFSMVAPLLSRSLLLTLQPLGEAEIATVLDRALADERGYGGRLTLEPDAAEHLVRMAGGDARRALTYLEAAADAAPQKTVDHDTADATTGDATTGDAASHDTGDATTANRATVDLATVERAVDTAAVRYDRAGDQHYDVVSAWIKSMRGSDPDAALHYLARMIEAGEDPRFLARRLMVHASEDVGLADPTALQAAVAASHVVATVGLPEARLALAQATLHIALAPKSNAVITAYGEAAADVRAGLSGAVPAHLRDAHYAGANRLGHGQGYRYPHDEPDGVVRQQYAPQQLTDRRYYRPTARGAERLLAERLQLLRERVAPGPDRPGQDAPEQSRPGHD